MIKEADPRPRVFIATPSHDHKFHASFAFSLFKLQATRLFPLHVTRVGGAGVARARNNQAQEFLTKTDCDIFACVDGDIGFEPENFARCVAHITHGGKLNVNGLYCLKQRELAWCINALPGEEMDLSTGLQRVATAGTGFKFIHRNVFERMIAAHPEIAYKEDLSGERGITRWDFFSMGVVEGRYLTEDWYFDYRCGKLGIPVHVDCTFHLKHEGMISYPIDEVVMEEAAVS
jgi:hypothetical protein